MASNLARTWPGDRLVRMRASLTLPDGWLGFWLLLSLVVAAEFGALVPVIFSRGAPVAAADVVYRVIGGSFAVCGLIAWHRRPGNRSGALMITTGLAFFAYPLLAQLHSSLAQTVGLLFADVWTIVFAVLLLSFPTGRELHARLDRLLVGALVVSLLLLQFVWMLFLEQPGNLLLVAANGPVADVLDKTQRALTFSVCLLLFLVVVVRWQTASRPLRRALALSVAGGVSLVLYASLLLNDLVAGSRSQLLIWLTLVGLVSVPVAFLVGLLRSRLARGGLSDLLLELPTMRSGALQAALAKALRDPALVLAYWLPEFDAYVDAEGTPVCLPAVGSNRTTARVEQDGEQVAALIYDASLDDEPELLDAVCAAAGIALEKERLHAELRARLAELQASRARIVEAGDAERSRLERNLHDGAQQRLTAVSMQLRLIQARIRDDPEAAEEMVTAATDELAVSLDELRELAHGIHPAVLDHGLGVALESLAARSAVPTTVTVELSERLPRAVEVAAYFVASEALANIAKYAQATAVTIRVHLVHGVAAIEIVDNGIGGADDARGSGLRGLADRVEALNGSLRVTSRHGEGTSVWAEMPCVS